MDKKVILGSAAGGLAMLAFALGLLLLMGQPMDVRTLADNLLVTALISLLAPFAGGFLAGLIGTGHPRQAGLLAGLGASLVVMLIWLVNAGASWEAIISGLALVFVWAVLSRIGAGLALPR
jgi:hypothetical protein